MCECVCACAACGYVRVVTSKLCGGVTGLSRI